MPSNWLFDKDKTSESKENTQEFDVTGAFDCQTCDERVNGAHLDRSTGNLTWRCSQGHISKIEEFI